MYAALGKIWRYTVERKDACKHHKKFPDINTVPWWEVRGRMADRSGAQTSKPRLDPSQI